MSGRDAPCRIAMVAACPFPYARGTPIRIQRMAEALVARGHRVDVYTYHYGAPTDQAPFRIVRIPGVAGYRRGAPGPSIVKLAVLDPQLAWTLLQGVRRQRYDVIHAHHVEGLLAAQPAARVSRTPIVYDVHTLLGSELPYYRRVLPRSLLGLLGRAIDRSLPRFADHVIAVSDTIRSNFIEQGEHQEHRISLIPNGVENELFGSRASWEARGGDRLVYAGNLAAYQGFDLLLHAFARVRSKRQDVRLQVITDDPLNGHEALAKTLGVRDAIDLSSATLSHLGDRLAAVDVAINPRVDCAGLPQKLLNYMAAGCPIVTFEGSAKHIVHEQSGLVVADNDIEGMASAMLRLLSDRPFAARLGQSAQNYARTELSWSRVAERVEQVYEKVIGARRT